MEMCPKRVRLGDALAALGRKVGLTDEDIAAIDRSRDKTPATSTVLTGTLFKASERRSTSAAHAPAQPAPSAHPDRC
jgi:hypothetical protein